MLFLLFSLLMTPVAIYAFKDQQVGSVLRISALLFLVGAWLRSGIASNGNFNFVAAGSALIASSSPFFVISQSIVAKKWFPDTQQTLALSLTSAGIPIGILASFFLTGMMFRGHEEGQR